MSARHFGLIGIHAVGRPVIDVDDIHVISNKDIFMCMYSCVNNIHMRVYNIKSDVYELSAFLFIQIGVCIYACILH